VSTRLDWGKILRLAATAGFMASAALHLSTFTPFPPASAAAIALALLVVAFGLLAAMVVRLREAGAPVRGQGAVRMVEWRTLLGLIPEGPKRAGVAVIAYVLMNLMLCLLLGDTPRRQLLVRGAGICGCLLDQFGEIFPYCSDAFVEFRDV